jgi:hypothetical protein
MNFITKKHISRRAILRGAGVSLSLPLLESMIPAQTPLAGTAANPKTRLSCIYVPHGAVMDKWTPAAEGTGFEFTEILKPLEPFRDHLNVLTNLAHPAAGGVGSDAGADHQRSAAVYLSGAHPERAETRLGVTIDQIAAQKIGQDTPLPSLELSIEDVALNCGSGFGCAYMNTMVWKTATMPLPMENNPQVVFEKLFGDGSNEAQRISRKQQARSLLDSLGQEVASLNRELPASDRAELSDYLEDIREIERRIDKASEHSQSNPDLPESPVGIPDSFTEHVKLMFDMQVLAWRADITRVATLMFARDTSAVVYPESGVRSGFHSTSHHSNIRANMDTFARINTYHTKQLAYFLDRLNKTPDGDGTLLDHSMVLYGSSMSNSNQHDHDPLPIVLAGGASGRLQGDRHIKYAPHTPMSNLLVSMLNKLGIPAEKQGDSTGKLEV